MNLSLVRKPSAVHAQTYSEPEKENEGGGKTRLTHFETKSCGLRALCLWQRRTPGQYAQLGTQGLRGSALCMVTLRNFATNKSRCLMNREGGFKSSPLSPCQFSMEKGHWICGLLPISSLPSPLLVPFHSLLFLLCQTLPVLGQEYHGRMLWGLQKTLPSIHGATPASKGYLYTCCCWQILS